MSSARKVTIKIHDATAEGLLTWEIVAKAALLYMSEDDVADMSICEEFFPDEIYEDDEDEDEDDYEEGDRIEESPFLRENDPDTDLFDGDIIFNLFIADFLLFFIIFYLTQSLN